MYTREFFGGEGVFVFLQNPGHRENGTTGHRDNVGFWRGGLVFFFWETGIPGDRETGRPVYRETGIPVYRSTVVLRRAGLL